MPKGRRAVLIAGPTASGKSALALERARALDGIIVNADALQVYGALRILTARPTAEDEAAAPHKLYGTVAPETRFSTGAWARAAQAVIAKDGERPLIFVGGTGLYFEALTKGFAEVPEVPEAIVAEVTAEVAGLDRAGREQLIAARDPAMAAKIQAADPQRVIRALAVLRATGRSLASFQAAAGGGLLAGFEIERLVLNVDRQVLGERMARRFAAMVAEGGVEEARALLALGLDPGLPVMKAIGISQIGGMLAGRVSEAEAVELAVIATRQYGKRQRTWFANRMADWTWI